jgi:hypothetical protein
MEQPLLSVEFQLDENILFYERDLQSVADVLSNTGGFMTLVLVIVGFLVAPIQ